MSDPEHKKSFLSIFEELSKNRAPDKKTNGHDYHNEGDLVEEFEGESLFTDEIDHQILMQRDAHFGGDFEIMHRYYENEASFGVHPDIDIERISYLAEVEKEMGQDLAPLILTAKEAEAVARARSAYAKLKEIYEFDDPSSPHPRLLADLILNEEEEPEAEIAAVVAAGPAILPELFSLLKADEFYDPLFPGYGYAPYLAILAIGQIGDPSGIVPLFETLSNQAIFDEMVAIDALVEIGDPAKKFLINVLKSRPLTQDNFHAAFALTAFTHDPQVAILCFDQLQDPEVQDKPLLRSYLINNCEGLKKTPYAQEFITLSQDPNLPEEMRSEMRILIEEWGK